ncbi:DUF4406 domain-containing protein [Burkholderia gladioli]|uniref:DUF4406 domain-containing protein n=1 Tax=Burkholderia gladioli TaxID=28095 RepID=UPI000CFE9F7D|nr:DUF4406 domain-containing protein [Burkholderia gladioli]PRH37751.1 hypothetical protein C6V07_01580 [Burkholderia gladioli]
MKLYLAGPMSGIAELNFPAFRAEAVRLRSLGFEIVNPAEINADTTAAWLDCMRADIKQLVDCDGIALLDGWEGSRGAGVEHQLARGLGLRVFRAKYLIGMAGDLPVLAAGAIELEMA